MTCRQPLSGDDTPAARLEQRIILVTGAGGGIGSATCLACAREGATVLLLDKNQRALDRLYDAIVAERLPEPVEIREDLATLDSQRADALAEQTMATFGRLDVIIHAAQESAPLAPLEHYPVDVFARVLHAQVTAPWILSRTLLPALRHSSQPRIVFSSGRAGRKPRAYHGATAVAWSGIDTMAAIMAEEFETNERVRVFSLDPGEVDTDMFARWYPGRSAADLPRPETVARAYVFLASAGSATFDGPLCALRDDVLESVDQTAS